MDNNMNLDLIILLMVWSFFSLMAGFIASIKKRDTLRWFLTGLILGPFALIVLLVLKEAPRDGTGGSFANPEIQQMVSKGIYRGWKEGKLNLYQGDADTQIHPRSVHRNVEARNLRNMSIGRPVKIIHTNAIKRKPEIF